MTGYFLILERIGEVASTPLDPRLSACSSRLCNHPGADGRGPQQGLILLQAPAFPPPDLLLLLMLRPGWDDYRVLIFNDLPPLLQ